MLVYGGWSTLRKVKYKIKEVEEADEI